MPVSKGGAGGWMWPWQGFDILAYSPNTPLWASVLSSYFLSILLQHSRSLEFKVNLYIVPWSCLTSAELQPVARCFLCPQACYVKYPARHYLLWYYASCLKLPLVPVKVTVNARYQFVLTETKWLFLVMKTLKWTFLSNWITASTKHEARSTSRSVV